MKKLNKIVAAILTGAVMTGCNDLNTQPQGSTITADQKAEVVRLDPAKAEASVSGLTAMLTSYGLLSGGASSDLQSDIGIPTLFIQMEMRGQDMYSIDHGYNWYNGAQTMTDGINNTQGAYNVWGYSYKFIRASNEIIASTKSAVESTETSKDIMTAKFYAAQGYGFRAFAYFYLAQSYQFTYKGNEQALCVPILTEENSDKAAVEGAPRATVQQVYDLILSDLDTAIKCLDNNTAGAGKGKYFISKAAAHGLRARVNLVMNRWAEAAADAQTAIAAAGAPLSIEEAGKPGFNVIDDHNWIWGIKVSETDRVVTTGICNFPSHMGSFSNGYATAVGAWKWISATLYAKIPTTDVRKGWWLDSEGNSVNLTAEQLAYLKEKRASARVQVKFAPYKGELDTGTNASDIPMMRVEEMYLILAEAQGMLNPATGKETLVNFVQTYRDPAYTLDASTSEAVQNAVWNQRRIELWGEGLAYYDLLRLKKGIDRVGTGTPATCEYRIAADDPVLIYPIPESEVQVNSQINQKENVLGGIRPTPYQQ